MSDGDIKKDMLIILLCPLIVLLHSGSLKLVLGSWLIFAPRLPSLIQMLQSSWWSTLGLQIKTFLDYTHVLFCSAAVPKHQHPVLAVGHASLGHTTLHPTLKNLCRATSEPRPSEYVTLWAFCLCFLLADASWNHLKLSGGSNNAAGEDQAFLYPLLTHLHHKATWCPVEHLLGCRRSHVALPE